ncbi:MAG: STAS domain-containing protein [Acidimicrobiia bacterium]
MVITDTVSRLDHDQTRVTLEPHGEIDAGSVEELALLVQGALCRGAHELDVDLHDVTFMDTAALRVLEAARDVLTSSGGYLCLRNPAPQVRRLLRLTAFCPGPTE